jgi:PPM family protein phosphatase
MKRVEKTHLPVSALTHPGMKGKNNEDRFGVSAFRLEGKPATPVLLAVLSDGIGGNRAGEVASELAVNLISQYVMESDGHEPTRILQSAIQQASDKIYQQAQTNIEQHGMGATCACAWISGDRLYTATVGDSRIYLMQGETIHQLSIDHTWIQEALERGLLQPDQVNGHPNLHVIRRYLGSQNPPEVDFRMRLKDGDSEDDMVENQGVRLRPGDRVLLCSDGLTDLVKDEEILATFRETSLEDAGQRLVDLANERGGHDNITMIAIQVPLAHERTVPVAAPLVRPRALAGGCLVVLLAAALIGGLVGGYMLYFGGGRATATPTPTLMATLTRVPSPTRTPVPTRTRTVTPTLFGAATGTPTPLPPGSFPSPTVIRVGTATPPLPVVTVSH